MPTAITGEMTSALAFALRASSSLLLLGTRDRSAEAPAKNGYAIVDRRLTRC